MTKFEISIATKNDIELLTRHRIEMWKNIRPELKEEAKAMEEVTRTWIKKKLVEGKIFGFIARTSAGQVAGSGCIWLREDAPRPFNVTLESPYLMSMYTETDFRRTGVARKIVQHAIDWSRERGFVTMNLHASESGAPLYESFGFAPTTEMRLKL